jgi:hypothetical protein
MAGNSFRYPFARSNNYLGAYNLLSGKAALPIMESMEFGNQSVNSSASGVTVTYTYSFIAGTASGNSGGVDGTVAGVTLPYALALVSGAANASSQVSGQTLSFNYSFVSGAATASSQAAGQTLNYSYSFLPGAATGGSGSVDATANGVTVGYTYSFVSGEAFGSSVISGGGASGVYRKKLSQKQEAQLEKAIDELLALESAVKQARTPRVRQKKLQQAASIAESIQDNVQKQFSALEFVQIDLSGLIATLNGMIEGAIDFAAQREALQQSITDMRMQALSLIQSDDDDMLLLLMLT